jgi:SAM-dependent methyltransferase
MSMHGTAGAIEAEARVRVPHVAAVARSLPSAARTRGLARTLRLAAAELAFDLRRGTDTAIEIPDAAAASGDRVRHEPVNPLVFRDLVARVPCDPSADTFLDLGAGKGRALLLAAELGFRRIVGVERSARLCAIARANAERCCARHPGADVEVVQSDAATMAVPDDAGVVFLFDPFGPEVVSAVVAAIRRSLAARPRALHVVYANARLVSPFVAAGFEPVYRAGVDGVVLRPRAAADA